MSDVHSPEIRSKNMRAIRSKDTKPEVLIRKLLHKKGFRYRLHPTNIPSKPDIYFPKYKAAIWVHGCFWHGHDCHLFKWPESNTQMWKDKITNNKKRDAIKKEELDKMGIRVLTVWECALKGKCKLTKEELIDQLKNWLLNSKADHEIPKQEELIKKKG